MKKENSMVKAGVVLVVSGFIVKLLSALYRIPLTRMLGAAQMGRYSAVFSFFMPFFSFATAGIIPCISHFTAKLNGTHGSRETARLYRTAVRLYITMSAVACAAFVTAGWYYSQRTADSLFFAGTLILAPNIIFAASENISKGLTQGRMNMMPTATANVMESVFKTSAGLAAVYFVKNKMEHTDADLPVKAALLTVTAAGLICCAYLLWAVSAGENNTAAEREEKIRKGFRHTVTAGDMYRMSFPVAVSALTISLVGFFDTAVCLPRISQIPYQQIVASFDGASFKNAQDMPMYLLGIYQGMVLSVFNLLPAVLGSVGSAVLPVISRAFSRGDVQGADERLDSVFRFTSAVSVPLTVYIFIFRRDILSFLFATSGAQTVVSSQLLAILMLSGVFCCFTSVFNSALYAVGKSDTVFAILVAASAARCTINYILCGIPQINIKAFAVSASAFYTIIFILSVRSIRRQGINFRFGRTFFLPCVSAVTAGVSICAVSDRMLCYLPLFPKLFFSSAIYGLIYILVMIISGFRLISPPEKSKIYKE